VVAWQAQVLQLYGSLRLNAKAAKAAEKMLSFFATFAASAFYRDVPHCGNRDEIEGTADRATGKAREAAGKLTGDERLRDEGQADEGRRRSRRKGSVATPFCTEFTVQNMASNGLGAHWCSTIPRFVRKTLEKRAAGRV